MVEGPQSEIIFTPPALLLPFYPRRRPIALTQIKSPHFRPQKAVLFRLSPILPLRPLRSLR